MVDDNNEWDDNGNRRPLDPHQERFEKWDEDILEIKDSISELTETLDAQKNIFLELERYIAAIDLNLFLHWAQEQLYGQYPLSPTTNADLALRVNECIDYLRTTCARCDERIKTSKAPRADVEDWKNACRWHCQQKVVPFGI